MNKTQSNSLFISCLIAQVLFLSCSHKNINRGLPYNNTVSKVPDYSDLKSWASHPWKHDRADEVPAGLTDKKADSIADVFFIHPTTYTDPSMRMGWNADIEDVSTNEKTDDGTILYQASVFNRYCRIFAPRYRQANLNAFFSEKKDSAELAFDLAYQDVKRAFEFYLQHYNNGRPIIIASHSQGTLHAGRLLKEFFEGKPQQKQLVAAYLIGLPVFKNYFSNLKPCTDSSANSCFVSWRTFREGFVSDYIAEEKQQAIVINPLTWTSDTTLAPAALNKGGLLRDFNKVIPGVVHARIHGNVLWVNRPKFFGSIFLTMKNYHIADYNLYYSNIRENVGSRIRAFLRRSQ